LTDLFSGIELIAPNVLIKKTKAGAPEKNIEVIGRQVRRVSGGPYLL